MISQTRTQRTLYLDILRSCFEGIVLTGSQTLCLLILIEVFLKPKGVTGELSQSMVSGSTYLGMGITLFYGALAHHWYLRKSTWAALPVFVSGVFFTLGAFSNNLAFFVASIFVAQFFFPARLPYLTSIYQDNYPIEKRGHLRSISLIVTQFGTIAFAFAAGKLLKNNVNNWRWIIASYAVCCFLSFLVTQKIPTKMAPAPETKNPLKTLKLPFQDKIFGYLLLVWFVFGFANLWILPIRITYLSNTKNFDPEMVTILAAVIPEITRLVFIPVWAYLFDRANFIAIRIALNTFFAVGIFLFFQSETAFGIGIAALLHGIGLAGGSVAWDLWVTKMAPPKKATEYMALHVAFTGVRGFLGPIIGFSVLAHLNATSQNPHQVLAAISVGLFVLSVLMLIPIIPHGRKF
jgi:MFS family permease